MRVGDADREHVAGLLQRAVGEGMLTLDEFSDRMDVAMAARTRGDLEPVLADLPDMRLNPAQRHAPPPSVAAPLPISVTMSSVRRSGHWHVPDRITLKSRFSDVTLDFTQADVRSPVLTIDVDDICSGTDIILPDDFTADINALNCLGGSATCRATTSPPTGRVHVVIRGRVRFGALTVKHPFASRLRRMWGGR